MKRATILIVEIIICTVCFSQREKIDSLKKILAAAKDTQRINCLNTLSRTYYHVHADTALLFATAALSEAQKLQYTQGLADAFYNSGRAEIDRGHNSISIQNFTNAIELYKKLNNTDMLGSAYENLAEALSPSGNFTEAIEAHNNAIQLLEKAKDSARLGWALTMTGWDYQTLGNYEKTFELFNQSMQIGEAIHDHVRVLYTL